MCANDEVPERPRDREQGSSYEDSSYDEVVRRLMVRQRELRGGTRVPGAPAEPPIDPGPSGRTPNTGEAGGPEVHRGSEDASWARLDVGEPGALVLDLTNEDEHPAVEPWADLAAEIDRLEIRIDETAAGLAELRFALHDLRDELERGRR